MSRSDESIVSVLISINFLINAERIRIQASTKNLETGKMSLQELLFAKTDVWLRLPEVAIYGDIFSLGNRVSTLDYAPNSHHRTVECV